MIRIENLSYQYPGTDARVLENVSLNIEEGSLFGLLGPNGAGKTTLISALVGILKGYKGEISIDNSAAQAGLVEQRSLIGYVPQDYAFYEELTASENLQFFAGVQGLDADTRQKRINECLNFCQLQSVSQQRAGTYSGGLKRRLNMAIGLLNDPEVLILDEPTVSIDPQSRAFILEQIKALNDNGKTIIYTSHYMEEVEQLCDYIAILDGGKVLQQGTLASLQQGHEQLVIGCKSVLSEKTLSQLASTFSLIYDNRQLVFNCVATMTEYHKIVSCLESLELDIASIDYGNANLEQVFLKLTHKTLRD